ncbi:hypothetical protein EPK99_06760 [Neorhizobium lilium]|uniref:Transmembrane anchored protein n=1 Tax=Neorhizobium lilium TaxID=2503024 RepID=A0A3S3SZD1_9HYPH|nr:hypothetical protein [Neorhizobium lilium]RWX78321.1 hypothetical protein EPK99_06760 [Neorhizobium lilium]
MAGGPTPSSDAEEQLLLSSRVLYRAVLILLLIAVLTAGLSIGGRWLGQMIALGGHTESSEEYPLQVGQDVIELPANTIRFREQRHAGPAERVDLYLAWPEMRGYGKDIKERFDDVSHPESLIFLQLSQSTMSRDMSGRLEPIYSRLFQDNPQPAEFGLTLHRLRPDSGYGKEVILTAPRAEGDPYVVRCLLPAPGEQPTSGDCQRDIRVGRDLTVLYRFSGLLLRDWQHIDAAVQSFVAKRLAGGSTAPVPAAKMPPNE